MKVVLLKTVVMGAFACALNTVPAIAQSETQEDLFQKYQAMVIIEEANQHCPLLSRLEAEVLNGQIVFANDTFSGKLDAVEKFKKEARIFARRAPCNSAQIMNLIGIARQHANDSMVNHMLLARQIHLLDEQDRQDGKIESGLLLAHINDDGREMLDNLYEEVKSNYLSQATVDDWETFQQSVVDVAEEKTTLKFLTNENLMKVSGVKNVEGVQARANNAEIKSYYYNLEKSVRAFVEGANAEKTGFPYSRPANDFTNWTSYRPRTREINWVLSYEGCGAGLISECTLFISAGGDVGLALKGDVKKVMMEFRAPDDEDLYRANKAVEGPIGSNELNEQNMNDNLQAMLGSSGKRNIEASYSAENKRFSSQTGVKPADGTKVFMFPAGTLDELDKLKKNDVVKLTVEVNEGDDHTQKEYVIPVHNYHRAKNWAYSTQ